MSGKSRTKRQPNLKTDAEAEQFVETADLSAYDLSGFKPVSFEFEKKNTSISMRLPASQLAAVKQEAEKRGIPYQRFMRELLQRGMDALHSS